MMKHLVSIVACILCITSCKKVEKKVNSEKPFIVYFMDRNGVLSDHCFDKVNGDKKGNLSNCSNYNKGIELPLSINADSCRFLFTKGKKTDTLVLHYTKFGGIGNSEYEISYTITKMKTTFDSVTTKCIPDLTPDCNGNKATNSVVVYK